MTAEGQERFIDRLYDLADENKEGALQAFLNLEEQKDSMKEGVWKFYEKKLTKLNNPQLN
jgi:hypothetical protein